MMDDAEEAVGCINTDRELWRERPGDFYADSLFVTESGGIGMNVGGHCIVKPIRDWHKLAHSECAEPGIREQVIKVLWQKQFEGSPWHDKFHLIRLDSLTADYGPLADKIIAAVRADIEQCFTLTDRRSAQ